MNKMRRKIVVAIRIVLLSIAGFLATLYACQSGLVYFPQKELTATPKGIGLNYEEVTFKAKDGVKLYGWFVPAGRARGTVLFCHGNAGNISHRLDSIAIFHRLGLNVFIFDYRGYGRSEGKPTEEGTYHDAEGAWNYLLRERQTPSRKIAIFGRSLGGAVAARLAQDCDASVLILESTFTSFRRAASDLYPWLPVHLLARYDYETQACLARVRCPVLIIHSRQDELIPFAHGESLFNAAKEPKAFLEIAGTHNDGFIHSGIRYEDGLNTFLTRYMGKP